VQQQRAAFLAYTMPALAFFWFLDLK